MSKVKIAVIAGDGIGTEVIPEGIRTLEAAGKILGVVFEWTYFDWSCETYHKTGRMMPEDGLKQLKSFDAIYLGAVGFPGVPDHISLWGLLLPIRRAFEQYVNLRPIRLFEGVPCPLAGKKPGDIDFYVVRENVEGEYSAVGGIQYEGTEHEIVSQQSIFTRRGTDRILKYAFDLAQSRKAKHLTSATKSNGIFHSMPYWDSRVGEMAKQYPNVKVDQYHIDILTANFVLQPEHFDVVVGSNLFGDILSDLGPACTGTIAIAPSANINPSKEFPSMFEPVHGSAPDIAGQGIANPLGTIWAGAMMMQHLGYSAMHDLILSAIENVLKGKQSLTRDMGGTANTRELTDAVIAAISRN
ncbi:tartrate dehydrogenase [Shewanella sp. SW36]|uniref:tartrate dehydrogenase n=1 Tax=Shewanella TaxID=22 RepID=UPI0021D8F1F7|nr:MULTISPECIES: tartrate dehydrogenase [unclassified Shewanella]MCU7974769.1 tartrate dehydrogenase [Shewanella sp. SW36]MCU7990158.1 tartrate dehydrogenase [Shewanella sp. SW1]MCU8015440.1 tartrate dehydrogenase [Shewanella sp. SM72]MCU8052088.1 tartrate dehydrogenase [Shewanella sp. SM43]MCU8075944.1 tartrate dehydrogenase [Shewanella sp. SM29]